MASRIGKYTYGTNNIKVHRWTDDVELHIGSFCSIATNCNVFLGGNHRTDWITTYPFGHINRNVFPSFDGTGHPSTRGNVVIGHDVWISSNVTIMSGVTIGDGAVITCNSHVVKNVEPYTIVGGNPAKPIKRRFAEDNIHDLLQIQWWNWSDSKINDNVNLLCSGNISEFLNLHQADTIQ